jgi:peroxiredoxin
MQIKYIHLLLLPLLLLAACGGNNNKFTVSGDISNMPEQWAYLEELNINELVVLDSVKTDKKGTFDLTGKAPEPGLYRIRFQQGKYIMLSIDKGTVKISADWDEIANYKVTGSVPSESLKMFLATVRSTMGDFQAIGIVMDSMVARGNDSLLAQAKNDMQRMNEDFTRYIENYADTVHYLPNALFAVQMLNAAAEKDYLAVFVQSMATRFPNAKMAKDFAAKYNQIVAAQNQQQAMASKGLQVGTAAPEISLPTAEDKVVTLSSLKGKYVLVDFWASWCGPCRKENPNVVAAYNKFKDKNFTILGVSLDDDKEKWQAAIEKDGLPWTHVSDLKGWESIAARTYSVESIPTNFLVNPEGKIVARDLRGEDLAAKLAEVLK